MELIKPKQLPKRSNEISHSKLDDSNSSIEGYIRSNSIEPLFLKGDSLSVLKNIPNNVVDMCITSPPYWQKRQYAEGGIGLEATSAEFINNLSDVFHEVFRVLKPTGSFWLNIGDTYEEKDLLCIPWRLIDRMKTRDPWILRNTVVWNKVKGGLDNTKDRLGNVWEPVFHLVKDRQGYYFDADSIRSNSRQSKIVNGSVVSATGVSGIRYKRQIELSTVLSSKEKKAAFSALEGMLDDIRKGKYSDFRMIIRGQQRTTHSDSSSLSGRAKELAQKGFYFLRYHPKGAKPRDVWEIIPEDTQNRNDHFAPYPQDLCKLPVLATCPEGGLVLDPFCGTGTTNLVAKNLKRKSIGVDISAKYLVEAGRRCQV
jgi:DNA modification methylase